MKLNKNDFDNWWNNPVALEFKKMLKEDMEKLAHGNMVQSFARDHIQNAIEVGRYQRTLEIHNLSHEQLLGDE